MRSIASQIVGPSIFKPSIIINQIILLNNHSIINNFHDSQF